MDAKIYILFRYAKTNRLYRWMDQCDYPVQVVQEPIHDWEVPADAALLVTHEHYRWEELSFLRSAMERNRTPVLILADGILEYRNTWQHDGLPEGSMFQPVFGHKLACIGAAQAMRVASWGNGDCCEVVGLPSLDGMTPLAPRQRDQVFRVLLATAKTPYFNQQQRDVVLKSLRAFQTRQEGWRLADGREVEIHWRIADDLADTLGIVKVEETKRPTLCEVIANVDAVVTTPSTLFLESCLLDRPTAILDFHNTPAYVASAWSITADDHVVPTLESMAALEAPKMLFQRYSLRQNLQCGEPAMDRMVKLVNQMVQEGIRCRESGVSVNLPSRILSVPQPDRLAISHAELYPQQPAFAELDRQRLQVELSAAIQRLGDFPDELAQREAHVQTLLTRCDKLNGRIKELHDRVVALRTRFGVTKDNPGGAS